MIFVVASSPHEPDILMLGRRVETNNDWSWVNISVPSLKLPKKVRTVSDASNLDFLL